MNIHNLINTNKMYNIHVDFKRFLKLLAPEEQVIEINQVINKLNKSNLPGYKISRRFHILKDLNDIKKEIIYKHH